MAITSEKLDNIRRGLRKTEEKKSDEIRSQIKTTRVQGVFCIF